MFHIMTKSEISSYESEYGVYYEYDNEEQKCTACGCVFKSRSIPGFRDSSDNTCPWCGY